MPILPEGRYKAITTSADVVRKGTNNLYAIALAFEAYEEKGKDGAYTPVAPGYTIRSNQFIQKKDGTLADAKIKTLSHVYEWDGDLTTVNEFAGKHARITVKNDGKYTDVSWINHINDGDDATASFDVDTARAAQAALGRNIRALGLGKPRTAAPTPPAAPPSTPPTAPPAPRHAAIVIEHSQQSVWEEFVAHMERKQVANDEHSDQWFQFLKEHGVEDAAAFGDWARLADAVAAFEPLPF